MILVMNPITQHNKARDGLVVTNLGKLGQAIEAYQAAEGSYPATFEDGDNGDYVKNWPTHPDGENYTYRYNSGDPCIGTKMPSDNTKYMKWRSEDGRTYKSCSNNDGNCNINGCTAL